MRMLVPILVLAASGCEFGDNRRLSGAECTATVGCAEPDGGGGGDGDAGREVDGGGGEVDAADHVEEACTLVEQTGCPAGRACDLDDAHLDSGGTTCRRIDEDGDETSLCDLAEECGAGFTCVADPAGGGSCLAFCADDGDCDGPGGACEVELVDEDDQPIPGGTLCTQSCNPISSNGCPASWGCRVQNDYTECRPDGPGRHFDPCAGDEDCDAGFGCVDAGGTPVCLRNCRVGVLGVCSAISGSTCRRYLDPVVIGGVEYGACL
jgi:hypothetical protein